MVNTTKTVNQAILDLREANTALRVLLAKRDEAFKIYDQLDKECAEARDRLQNAEIELENSRYRAWGLAFRKGMTHV